MTSVEIVVPDLADALRAAQETRVALSQLAMEHLTPETLLGLLRELRSLEAAVGGAIATIGARANDEAERGRCAPAAEFLLDEGAVRASTARAEAGRAAVLGRLPGVADPVRRGEITTDKLDVLARRTRGLSDDQLARIPADPVIADATRLPADTFDSSLRRRVRTATDPDDASEPERLRRRSEFRHWFDTASGMGCFAGKLDPERYEAMTSRIDHHAETLASQPGETIEKNPNLAAEALYQLVTSGDDGGPGSASITVVVDHQTLAGGQHEGTIARTADGHPLSSAAVARLCCGAWLRRVVHDKHSVPIDVGRRHRMATSAQRDAIGTLHSSCAWPGCTLPLRWTQIHHIMEWQDGGPTDLANLVPLCHRHHHRVHEGGWSIALDTGRTVSVYLPDGTLQSSTHPSISTVEERPPP